MEKRTRTGSQQTGKNSLRRDPNENDPMMKMRKEIQMGRREVKRSKLKKRIRVIMNSRVRKRKVNEVRKATIMTSAPTTTRIPSVQMPLIRPRKTQRKTPRETASQESSKWPYFCCRILRRQSRTISSPTGIRNTRFSPTWPRSRTSS